MGQAKFHRKRRRKWLDDQTIDRLDYRDDDLLIFADDTGEEQLRGHAVFGMGGPSAIGKIYRDEVVPAWMALRRGPLGLVDGVPFHTTDLLGAVSVEQRAAIADFLATMVAERSVCIVDTTALVEARHTLVAHVMDSLAFNHRQLHKEIQTPRVVFVFEQSDRLGVAMFNTAAFAHLARTGSKTSFCFMKKAVCEPGLEIADLLITIAGIWRRQQLKGSERHHDLMKLIVGDKPQWRYAKIEGATEPVWSGNAPTLRATTAAGPRRDARRHPT